MFPPKAVNIDIVIRNDKRSLGICRFVNSFWMFFDGLYRVIKEMDPLSVNQFSPGGGGRKYRPTGTDRDAKIAKYIIYFINA